MKYNWLIKFLGSFTYESSRCKMRVLEQPEKIKLKFNQLSQNPILIRILSDFSDFVWFCLIGLLCMIILDFVGSCGVLLDFSPLWFCLILVNFLFDFRWSSLILADFDFVGSDGLWTRMDWILE